MSQVFRYLYGVFLLFAMLFFSAAMHGQEVEFCQMPLSSGALQANATFGATYDFDTDAQGIPTNIKTIKKWFTDPKEAEACIRKWKLPQWPNRHFSTLFEWQHAIGWTRLVIWSVSDPKVHLSIRLSGEGSPYLKEPYKEGVNCHPASPQQLASP